MIDMANITWDHHTQSYIAVIPLELIHDLKCIMGHEPAHLLGEILFEEIKALQVKDSQEKYDWQSYPENIPTESGYYMTLLKYEDKPETFLKPVVFNAKTNEWIKWRPNLLNFVVTKYLPFTKSMYYTDCVRAFDE